MIPLKRWRVEYELTRTDGGLVEFVEFFHDGLTALRFLEVARSLSDVKYARIMAT